ncbi:MAG: hypothetical protein QXQ43_04130 [Nitrososphaerota archaeon]
MLVFTVIDESNNFKYKLNNENGNLLNPEKDYKNKIWFSNKINYQSGVVGIIQSEEPSETFIELSVGDKIVVFEVNDQDVIVLSPDKCIFIPETAKVIEEVEIKMGDIDTVYNFCKKYNFPEPITYAEFRRILDMSISNKHSSEIRKNLLLKLKGPLMYTAGFICKSETLKLLEFSDSEIDEIYNNLSKDTVHLAIALSRWHHHDIIARLISRHIESIPAHILEQVEMNIMEDLAYNRDMAVKILNKAVYWNNKNKLLEFFYKCFFELKSLNPGDTPLIFENTSLDTYVDAWEKLNKYIPKDIDIYKKYENKFKKEAIKMKIKKFLSKFWIKKN